LTAVLVREVVRPRWAPFRLGPPSLDGLTRRRGNGLVRLLHVGDEPVVVAASGTVFAARASSEAAAREGIARMRFAVGIDDDLAEFHERFRDDPLIGRALRAQPWLRVRRNPDPWETLMWAITEQLIDIPRATAIQRRMIAAFGHRLDGLREIGTWTVEMVALHGLGRLDVVPAADLGYLKLVGRLTTGRPKANADEAEVRGFFEPYAPWAGLAASYLIRVRTTPVPRRAGTRWSAAAPRRAAA
jgi:3-methyladenine DNA glycosylase/8-oxoguanine DNA glycosylase